MSETTGCLEKLDLQLSNTLKPHNLRIHLAQFSYTFLLLILNMQSDRAYNIIRAINVPSGNECNGSIDSCPP